MAETKEGNVLFNDTLNTLYFRLYGVGHMVKNHSDSERGNPLRPLGLLFPISSKDSFTCITPTDSITHTIYHIPVVEHWLVRVETDWDSNSGEQAMFSPRVGRCSVIGGMLKPLCNAATLQPHHPPLTIPAPTPIFSRSSQCSTTGVTKVVVCVILSVG